ncbi:hypothetical protein IWQ57_004048 [Coemansia nantahalensis]|uniref:Uncharacterized protein n=1 Tax=Coemansia nantahalensis TaxID=2789366 RepID=A0ACC1JUB3_9FUNG|nr:hypothetical protein IWQ57_004048 [Coemansia nantahalensis]
MDPHSFSVYTTHSSMSLGRATRGSRFERKRRADKLREFFGRADPGADEQLPPAAAAAVAAASAMSSIPSLPLRGVSLADAPLSAEQRNILVRRRRKLKALLGEQVEESVISLAPAVCPDTARSSASSQADVPFCVPELDGSACSLLTPEHTSQASSAGMSADAPPSAAPDAARQRAQRLRRFFGQSLNSEAMLMQGVAHSGSPALTDESFDIVPNAPADGAWPPFCASEGSAPLLLQEDPPVRAQFWVTDSPESQESVLTDEGAGPRSSLLKALRAHKASIIGSIRRPTPSMQPSARSRTSTQSSLASSTTGSQRNSAVATPSPGKLAMLARKIKPWPDAEQPVAMPPPPPPLAVARLVDDARSQPLAPPVRSSSIKPLSPLPGISPNNLQASIDRFIPPAMPQTVAFPPRVSSAAHADDHRQLVTAALLGAAPPGTRARRSNSAKARVTKSVHWFDSPDNAPELPLPPPPPDSAPPSAKTSLESSMAIVLRSPSTKRPAVKSPLVSPRTVASTVPARSRFPTLPIGSPTSGPRLLLSHKASISAVGGRLLQGGAERTRPAVSGSFSNGNGAAGSGGIVTIRARRSASFIVNRRLERATVGRKRSNTIGTGRQADAPSELRPPPPDDPNDIPRADKETRRVQSVILPAQYRPPEPPVTRGRCATVIPLHVELQQMLERRIAAAVERRTAPRRLRSPRMSDLVPMTAANKQQAEESLMQSLAMAANALCIASPLAPAAVVPPPPPPVRNAPSVGRSGPPRVKPAGRRLSIQLDVRPRKLTAATAAPVPLGRLRSNSCPARFVPLRKCSPIQPAIARYLQSAKAGQTRRNTKRMSGSYQRISMAMLARQHSIPRRSLDQRVVHKRKLSPYMESSVRKFGSLGSSSLRPPPGGK